MCYFSNRFHPTFQKPRKVQGTCATITTDNVKLVEFKFCCTFEMHLFCPAYGFNDIRDQVIKVVDIESRDLIDAGMPLNLLNNVPQLLE
jgi:hypothetical protein